MTVPYPASPSRTAAAGPRPQWPGPRFHLPETETAQNWAALGSHLAAHGMVFDPSRDRPRQFATGFGNLNYLIVVDGVERVLRRPPMGELPPGANDMRREYRILSTLWQAFPLAPRAFYHTVDERVLGGQFLIMEYRPGLTIGGRLPAVLAGDPALAQRLGAMLIDILADLHAIDPVAIGLGDFGRPEGFLERAATGWRKRLLIAADETPPKAALAVSDWLAANRVPDGAPTLLHNDFKLDNVLLEPNTLRPLCVIDWDQGTRGDPLFDLATLLSYWTEADDPPAMRELGQMPTGAPGFQTRREVVQLYSARTGRDVSGFKFHRVLAMFKLGVIFLQIYARYRRGQSRDERFKRFGPIVDGLFEFAHEVARGRTF
jgi:aminoglycoside phosphotransferase (APT) family kinase protein